MLAYAGWDEAVAVVQKRHQRKQSVPTGRVKRPIYGLPGVEAPGG